MTKLLPIAILIVIMFASSEALAGEWPWTDTAEKVEKTAEEAEELVRDVKEVWSPIKRTWDFLWGLGLGLIFGATLATQLALLFAPFGAWRVWHATTERHYASIPSIIGLITLWSTLRFILLFVEYFHAKGTGGLWAAWLLLAAGLLLIIGEQVVRHRARPFGGPRGHDQPVERNSWPTQGRERGSRKGVSHCMKCDRETSGLRNCEACSLSKVVSQGGYL